MATSKSNLLPHHLFFLSFALLIRISSSNPYLLPIIKDDANLQYYTTFPIGTPSIDINAVIDTGNLYSWLTCDLLGYTYSSSYSVIPCGSSLCSAYGNGGCIGCHGPRKPSCNNNSCGSIAYTPWSDVLYAGGLIGDTITLYHRHAVGKSSVLSYINLPNFPLTCADAGSLKGISRHTKGVVSLSRTPASLPAHVSSTLRVAHKFALCLPSSLHNSGGHKGAIYFGGGPYILPPSSGDISKYLVKTRLVVNPHSTAPSYTQGEASVEYYINIRSIKIQGKAVHFSPNLLQFDNKGNGGTKISTMTPYTKLHPEIYEGFVNLFVQKAEAMGIRRVTSVAPFGACFDSRTINYGYHREGRTRSVPIVDFIMHEKSPVLHNKNARWRFEANNAMVKVSEGVDCLAFVKGGPESMTWLETPIVIGGYQMQDNLVEFDLESNQLGFSSSLLRHGTSCFQL